MCANNGIHKKVYERIPSFELFKIGLGPFVNQIVVQFNHVMKEILYT